MKREIGRKVLIGSLFLAATAISAFASIDFESIRAEIDLKVQYGLKPINSAEKDQLQRIIKLPKSFITYYGKKRGPEKGLVEFRVGESADFFCKVGLDLCPQGLVFAKVPQPVLEFDGCSLDDDIVEFDAFHRIALTSLPIPVFEADERPASYGTKFLVVIGKVVTDG